MFGNPFDIGAILARLDPETQGQGDTEPWTGRGTPEQRAALGTWPGANLTLTLNAEPIRTATPSALRHRALCECWDCWSN